MPDHPRLPQPRQLADRRANRGGGGGAAPRVPGTHGGGLRKSLEDAIKAQRPTRTPAGVDPSYVFKIRARTRVNDSAIVSSDLQFLGDTEDWTYFVLAPGDEPTTLLADIDAYAAAGTDRTAAPKRTFLEAVDEILPYGPEDRRGPNLPAPSAKPAAAFLVDVVIWPSPSRDEAVERVAAVQAVLDAHSATALSSDVRPKFTVVRARIDGTCLHDLLELSVVELVRGPPIPRLEPSDWRSVAADDLPAPTVEDVAPIGLIDDGVHEHPLLPSTVIASRDTEPAGRSWAPPTDHGTMVAGILAYGSVEDAVQTGQWQAVGPIHAVRVLEPHAQDPARPTFPTTQPTHVTVENAIRRLHAEHEVRVFNLSITEDTAYSGPHVSVWTEQMDSLARELDVVLMIATGNHQPIVPTGHDHVSAYPRTLFEPQARVAEPAVAANVLTVGSIAHATAPQTLAGVSRPSDRAIAGLQQPSPFTRSGPGVGGGIKPEVVDHGGNWVLNDVDVLQDRDTNVSVLSLRRNGPDLFGVANGTSFAAPRVTRLAAQILKRYPGSTANLVRALIVSSTVPAARARSMNEAEALQVTGHGRPSPSRALESTNDHVAMVYEGIVGADTVEIHRIPIPREFTVGRTERSIRIALAFDPLVRRTRREYLASELTIDLYRAMDIEDVERVWRKQPQGQREGIPKDRRRPKLVPGITEVQHSTLQIRSHRATALDPDDGNDYFVVVKHTASKWSTTDERYALVVTLEDHGRTDIDLLSLVRARLPTRVRV